MIVMKFGGTSVKNAVNMRAIFEILQRRKNIPTLVVLSACGGMTDVLLRAAKSAGKSDIVTMNDALLTISTHHKTLVEELFVNHYAICKSVQDSVDSLLEELNTFCEGMVLLNECTLQSLDTIASFGERLSTTIFTAFCNAENRSAQYHDSRTTMRTNADYTHAIVDTKALTQRARSEISPLLDANTVVVTQGFIGATSFGTTTTLGRGGSDLSAALYGAALGATEIEIWTDVSGIFSADPRIAPNAYSLPSMTFAEVRELAYYGAKVLHPDTIKPAIEADIPVRVLNTFKPDDVGTVIVESTPESAGVLRSVTSKNSCILFDITTSVDMSAPSLSTEILSSVNQKDILYSALSESKLILVCPLFEHQEPYLQLYSVLDRYREKGLLNYAERDCSFVCVCGAEIVGRSAHNALVLVARALQDITTFAVSSGTSQTSIIAIVQKDEITEALASIHKLFE